MDKDNEILNEEIQEEVNNTPENESEAPENEEPQEEPQDEPQQDNAEDTAEDTEAPAEPEEAKDPLEEAQAKIDELNDTLLRKMAEFENYRKRTVKEKAELILNGGEKTVTKILPVIDDMERAIENGKKTDDVETLREGMDLIYKKFITILEGMGVKRIDTDGQDFDTDYHEAIAMIPGMGDDKKGKVIDCLQEGYKLTDKVIRHAKVAVGQ